MSRTRIASRSSSWQRDATRASAALIAASALGLCSAQPSAHQFTGSGTSDWSQVQQLGGTFSVYSYGESPYGRAAPSLTLEERSAFSRGAVEFNRLRAVNKSRNAGSCVHCHVKDGRGKAHAADIESTGFSVPTTSLVDGQQVRRYPDKGVSPQGKLEDVRWTHVRTIKLPGRVRVNLVAPEAIVDGKSASVDLRTAPAVYGLGLLESIPDQQLRELAQQQPFAKFGVKGRVSEVIAPGGAMPKVGRFGWKASFARLDEQVLDALANELGMAISDMDPGEFEATAAALTAYLRTIAVPARQRTSSSRSESGAKLFSRVGCAMCHTPGWDRSTVEGTKERPSPPEKIYPFTDLLLHDMGPGLRGNNSNSLGTYWRTPALWGIGLQSSVSPNAGFLHDGRARTILEAILWHGGESEYSIARFRALSRRDREDLLGFLHSL